MNFKCGSNEAYHFSIRTHILSIILIENVHALDLKPFWHTHTFVVVRSSALKKIATKDETKIFHGKCIFEMTSETSNRMFLNWMGIFFCFSWFESIIHQMQNIEICTRRHRHIDLIYSFCLLDALFSFLFFMCMRPWNMV